MHTSDGKALSSIVACLSDFLQLLQLRELWMVVLFSLCSFPVAAQWSASNVLFIVHQVMSGKSKALVFVRV